jgi:hypothetical protein
VRRRLQLGRRRNPSEARMTKMRAPASFEDAITRVAGVLGFEGMAAVVGKTDRAVRNWSDPDIGTLPTLEDAWRLDAAYIAECGGEPPILAAYALKLKRSAFAPGNAAAIAASMKVAAKEGGEALAALVDASQPGADQLTRQLAAREALEASEAFKSAAQQLVAGGEE